MKCLNKVNLVIQVQNKDCKASKYFNICHTHRHFTLLIIYIIFVVFFAYQNVLDISEKSLTLIQHMYF